MVASAIAKGLVACGMSGSPIVSMDGRAIGLISTGDKNPTLIDNLPKRLLSNMILACDEPVAQ
jgi:hypothetical protein